MNQGRIWCVVSPSIGLPLLLGSVTLISITVHASVLSNIPMIQKNYWQGHVGAKTAMASAPSRVASVVAPVAGAPVAAKVAVNVPASSAVAPVVALAAAARTMG